MDDDELRDALRASVPEPGATYWQTIDARLEAARPEPGDRGSERPGEPRETDAQLIRLTVMDPQHDNPRRRPIAMLAAAATIVIVAGASVLALTRRDDDPTDVAVGTGSSPTATEAPTGAVAPLPLAIPAAIQGQWRASENDSVTADDCRQEAGFEANFDLVLTIREDGFSLFETGGRLVEVLEVSDQHIDAVYDTTYADTPTEHRLVFDVRDNSDVLVVGGPDADYFTGPGRYVRCPEPTPPTSAEAQALIVSSGDWEPDMSTYDPTATLSAVQAVTPGAGSAGSPEQIFLFASGRYLGTATPEYRIASSFERIDDATLRLTYGHYAPTDAFCCPSLAPWTVDVRWEGGSLVYSGDLPPQDQGLG